MLNLLGRSTPERAKSITIGVLAGLLMVCLLQLSTVNAQAVREDQDRRVATDVAVRFAVALTTFDYAHPNVQVLQVAALSWQVVQGRVAASIDDIAATKASSVGY